MNDRRDWKVAFIGHGSKRNEPSTNYLKRTRTKDNNKKKESDVISGFCYYIIVIS